MPRSRSPHHKRHGSRSKSPGKKHHDDSPKHHHGRSKSPKRHGRSKSPKRHGRSKSPKHKHHHKKEDKDSGSESESDRESDPEPEPPVPAPVKVQASAPAKIQSSAPAQVEASAPAKIQTAAPVKVQTSAPTKTQQASVAPKYEPKFSMTPNYGGEGGEEFDHNNRRRVSKISVRAGKFVDGIGMTYMNGEHLFNGGEGGEEQSIELPEGEYVNEVKLRVGNVVQSITFITNKGRTLGPCGSGKGAGIGIFAKEGELVEAKAPDGYRLVGIKGRAGNWLDAIGFRWGTVPPGR